MNVIVQKLVNLVWPILEPVLLTAGKTLIQEVLNELQGLLDSHGGPMPPKAA